MRCGVPFCVHARSYGRADDELRIKERSSTGSETDKAPKRASWGSLRQRGNHKGRMSACIESVKEKCGRCLREKSLGV